MTSGAITSVGTDAASLTTSPFDIAQFQTRVTAQAATSSSAAIAAPSSASVAAGTPNFHAVVCPGGKKSDSFAIGVPSIGIGTENSVSCPVPIGAWYAPF